MLELTTEEGDVVVRSDENKSYMHNGGSAGTMADWTELSTPTDSVLSVNGETGTVVLTTGDIGEDANKKFVTDAEKVVIGNTSGTNTGDQTSISGISDTKANFDIALSDGNFAYSGGAFHDGFSDFVANEHIDWTIDQGLTDIHVGNIPDLSGTYQPLDADLTAIAGLSSADSNIIVGSAAGWVVESGATLRASIGVDAAGTDNSTDVTVTDSAEIDFTLTGQDITASLKTGSIDETKLDTSVNASLDLADSAIQPTGGTMTGALIAHDHGTAATDQIVNVCYGTGTPPAANTTTIGTIWVKYTA
jgi:hypothetical protein